PELFLRMICEAEAFEQHRNALAPYFPRDPEICRRPVENVGASGEGGDVEFLRTQTYKAPPFAIALHHVDAENLDRPRSDRCDPGDAVNCRGFSCAVGSQETKEITALDSE